MEFSVWLLMVWAFGSYVTVPNLPSEAECRRLGKEIGLGTVSCHEYKLKVVGGKDARF